MVREYDGLERNYQAYVMRTMAERGWPFVTAVQSALQIRRRDQERYQAMRYADFQAWLRRARRIIIEREYEEA